MIGILKGSPQFAKAVLVEKASSAFSFLSTRAHMGFLFQFKYAIPLLYLFSQSTSFLSVTQYVLNFVNINLHGVFNQFCTYNSTILPCILCHSISPSIMVGIIYIMIILPACHIFCNYVSLMLEVVSQKCLR